MRIPYRTLTATFLQAAMLFLVGPIANGQDQTQSGLPPELGRFVKKGEKGILMAQIRFQIGHSLAVCGGYVEAARLGYPDGFWWRTLLSLSNGLGVGPSSGVVPVSASGQVHDCKFVFVKDGMSYGVIACDEVLGNEKWLREAAESAISLLDAHKLASAVLIGRAGQRNLPDFLPGERVALVVERDPNRAAEKAIAALMS